MRFQVRTAKVKSLKTSCLIVPVYKGDDLPASTRAADRETGGQITALIDSGDMRGAIGDTLLLVTSEAPWRRIMLVGCGPQDKFNRKAYQRATAAAFRALAKTKIDEAVSCLAMEAADDTDPYRRARIVAETWHDVSYRFTEMKSKPPKNKPALKSFALATRNSQSAKTKEGLKHGEAIGEGMHLARDLGNYPANVCTPGFLAQQARAMAKSAKNMRAEVLSEANMKKLGMGSLLSVTAGTEEPAKLIVLHYEGAAKSAKPVVLVGKGVTFDSGGISLKPGPMMDEMKYDMCGAASVMGVFQALAKLQPKINVVGIIPACENMPSGLATKPGDIVTSMSGQTIEILNTDAEGRLILCDALTYAQRFEPAALIDIATLTGACLVALGRHRCGLMSNSDKLADALLKAGEESGDGTWRLPLDHEYDQLLHSNFADMANIGGRDAGTITAACFLQRFVEDSEWAHLDIAGTAWVPGKAKGGTGRPVPLLMEYLLGR